MSEFKPIGAEDREDFYRVVTHTYPGANFHSAEGRERFDKMFDSRDAEPGIRFYGIYRDGKLLGSMRLFDFVMNMRSATVDVGGVGFVAVDVAHKKERVAFELIQNYVRHFRERGVPMTALYPFRPDFYHKMGFGAGTQQNEYHVTTSTLPKGPSKAKVDFVSEDQRVLVRECYERLCQTTHGLFQRSNFDWSRVFSRADQRIVAYFDQGQIQGYILFTYVQAHPKTPFDHNMEVHELMYENPEALSQLMTFLQSQADQAELVIFHTQDEDFTYLLDDPRNHGKHMAASLFHETSLQGTGMMYRVTDTVGIWRVLTNVQFDVADCTISFNVRDSFLPENDDRVLVRFEHGYPSVLEEGVADIEISLDVAEFSSLLMGCVRFKSLYMYGRAQISDVSQLNTINRLFATEKKPICLTAF